MFGISGIDTVGNQVWYCHAALNRNTNRNHPVWCSVRLKDSLGNKASFLKHRLFGPAVIRRDGTREYWQNGVLHRRFGPAIVRPGGGREWWINGQQIKAYRKIDKVWTWVYYTNSSWIKSTVPA